MFSSQTLVAVVVAFVFSLTNQASLCGQLTFNFVDSTGTAASSSSIAPQAIQGFEDAGQLWSNLFDDPITVNIEIDFSSIPSTTGTTILGSTSNSLVDSPAQLNGSFPTFSLLKAQLAADQTSTNDAIALANLPVGNSSTGELVTQSLSFRTNNRDGTAILDDDVFSGTGDPSAINNSLFGITSANAKAVGLIPGNALGIDATITFNSDINFDFDRSDGISAGATDFVGVATHEIGHALGFVSGVDFVDGLTGSAAGAATDLNGPAAGIGELDNFALFSTLDLFRRSEAAFALDDDALDLSTEPNVFFSIDGDLTDGDDILLETGVANGTGNQASHFLDSGFGQTPRGILDPTAAAGELLQITQNDILVFDVIGYDLITSVPEPGSALGMIIFGVLTTLRRRRA